MLASESAKLKLMSFIKENNYQVGDMLPSETQLSDNLGLSRLTLREAINVLKSNGVVRPVQGKGTFIAADIDQIEDSLNSNISITDMIHAGGFVAGTKYCKKELVTAGNELAEKLDIHEGDNVVACTRIRTADGIPVVYSEDYLAPRIVPGFLTMADENISLFRFIEENENIRMGVSDTEIRPAKADALLAGLLEIEEGELLMEFLITIRDEEGVPLIWAREFLKPDTFRFVVHRIK
jgi:GntR family transcriptional regulator